MKVSILGGGGVRTPLLIRGLMDSRLPVDRVSLFDIDRERAEWMVRIARDDGVDLKLTIEPSVDAAIHGCRFVFASIRAGGIEARAADEALCRDMGLLAQETVGACGFALGVRNIPPMVEIGHRLAAVEPEAFLINFTNPVGMVTQAIASTTQARVIGICDTPAELFAAVAHTLELDPMVAEFDYFGLNHLGWLREVRYQGEPHMQRFWREPGLVDGVYRSPLFSREELERLKLLPSEYLFYYYHPDRAVSNIVRAGSTRGEALLRENGRLFDELSESESPSGTYRRYLEQREGSYFQLESGGEAPTALPGSLLTGYDRIAVAVAEALWLETNDSLPVNVPNGETMSHLDPEDVIEVVCRLGKGGATPHEIDPPPATVAPLISAVKRYERETILAASSRSPSQIRAALSTNPLVSGDEVIEQLAMSLRLAPG